MLLCDVGNTSYHFLKGNTDLVDKNYKESVKTFDPKTVEEKVYYICVHPKIKSLLKSLDNWVDLSMFIDMQTYYSTMGVDRIFACEAISNGIIVDAGSAITVDIVEDNTFQGGYIYPGSRVMNKSYADISSSLKYPFNYELDLSILPKNSQDAISYGYFKTLYLEVISHKKNIYLTGGDAKKFFKIFPTAKINENLIFDGMKKILYQVI